MRVGPREAELAAHLRVLAEQRAQRLRRREKLGAVPARARAPAAVVALSGSLHGRRFQIPTLLLLSHRKHVTRDLVVGASRAAPAASLRQRGLGERAARMERAARSAD